MFAIGAFIASHLFPQVNDRISDWLDPWSTTNYQRYFNGSFQIVQSQYSFGNGGLLGTGLGYGYWGGLFTTGELATDYIFIVFGQEMGLIGTSVIVAAFLLVVGSGLQIAQKARTEFSQARSHRADCDPRTAGVHNHGGTRAPAAAHRDNSALHGVRRLVARRRIT